MRRPLRITRMVCLALLCAGFLGAWSMRAWAYVPSQPKVPPVLPTQASSHPRPSEEPAEPKEPKVRPRPKEPKVRPRPKAPKARGRPQPPPAPVPVAPPPVLPPAPTISHAGAGTGFKSHSTPVTRASIGGGSMASKYAAPYHSLGVSPSRQPFTRVRLALSRVWISRSGPRSQRRTTFSFRLSRPTLVEFVLVRVAPDCRVVGKFRVNGRAGLNRVRFRGRIGHRVLRPGTYRVTARTLPPGGAKLLGVRLVIVGQPNPLPSELAAARASNACATTGEVGEYSTTRYGTASSRTPPGPRPSARESRLSRIGGVLAEQFKGPINAVKAVPPFLLVVLAFAIALLGLAATPRQASPSARLQALLAYRRGLVALAGTTILIGVVITYAVSQSL